MLFKPFTWSSSPTHIELLGYTNTHKTIYVKVPWEPTYLLQFPMDVSPKVLTDLGSLLQTSNLGISSLDPTMVRIQSSLAPKTITQLLKDLKVEIHHSPFDSTQSFWAHNELGPYTWLTISNYVPIFEGSCDLNLQASADDIAESDYEAPITLKLGFYYLAPSNKELSFITVHGTEIMRYVIVHGNIPEASIKNPDLIVISVPTETDLFKHFFTIYHNFKPDWLISYDDHLFKQLLHHELPKTSELIDLKLYYQRFYPHLNNHKLSTIAHHFLKKFPSITDPLENVYQTTVTLMDLFTKTQIQNSLTLVANNIGLSIKSILHNSLMEIIERAKYHIDFGTFAKHKLTIPNNPKVAAHGIYRDIFEYDYTELYYSLMLQSDDDLIVLLAERLEDCPPAFIMTAFYSCEVQDINRYLQPLRQSESVISMDQMIIRSKKPLKYSWTAGINHYSGYIVVNQTSNIIFKDSELILTGPSKLTQPSFEYLYDYINHYCTSLFHKKSFSLPKIETESRSKFYIREQIASLPHSLKQDLQSDLEVTYLMTSRGPLNIKNLLPDDTVDYSYYQNIVDLYVKEFRELKWKL